MAASNMVSLVMAGVLLTLSACSANTSQPDHADIPLQSEMVQSEVIQSSAEGQFEEDHKPEQNVVLYNNSPYMIFSNELIDTYFIACGLLFDFEGGYLFDSGMEADYQPTIEHFTPYKEHPFIRELEAYVDMENKYADMGVLYYLAQYVTSMSNTGLGIANIQSYSFQSDEEFYAFVENLYQFYQDTGAREFFKNSKLHKDQRQYLSEHMKDVPVHDLLQEMESYTGNKSEVFGGDQVNYCSLISVYKSPKNASFHTFGMNQDMYLTSIQSPLGFAGNFDVKQLFESYHHEALHMFINPGVEGQVQLIEQLAKDKSPSDFVSSQYENMPWHRITDEAIVRAVQARIYGIVYQNPELGYQEILAKEIRAGFQNIDALYQCLEEYESSRDKYPVIDDYVVKLVECYLNQV